MNDKNLIPVLRSRLVAGVQAAGWNYPVIQKNQPTLQGVEWTPQVFFQKLFDTHYGYAKADFVYNSTAQNFTATETQLVETTFQVSALVIQDPADLTGPTAADVVNYLKMFVSSRNAIAAYQIQKVSLLRVTEVRNPVWADDRDRYEYFPSFDVTFTHSRTLNDTVEATDIVVGKVVTSVQQEGTFPVVP